ncbi:hypothetical protein BYT27DRAFT_7249295 [Phlegmacium glaucopus]|nr:hypothetical protein BYT27DRAFT_7265755 [Phlegmacium glaucopus]KAF8815341.1 hypothetical protein BYT27DRAFT_7249295 [Phlegmacium glaucopus]
MKSPLHYPDDPWPLEDIYSASIFILTSLTIMESRPKIKVQEDSIKSSTLPPVPLDSTFKTRPSMNLATTRVPQLVAPVPFQSKTLDTAKPSTQEIIPEIPNVCESKHETHPSPIRLNSQPSRGPSTYPMSLNESLCLFLIATSSKTQRASNIESMISSPPPSSEILNNKSNVASSPCHTSSSPSLPTTQQKSSSKLATGSLLEITKTQQAIDGLTKSKIVSSPQDTEISNKQSISTEVVLDASPLSTNPEVTPSKEASYELSSKVSTRPRLVRHHKKMGTLKGTFSNSNASTTVQNRLEASPLAVPCHKSPQVSTIYPKSHETVAYHTKHIEIVPNSWITHCFQYHRACVSTIESQQVYLANVQTPPCIQNRMNSSLRMRHSQFVPDYIIINSIERTPIVQQGSFGFIL